MNPDERLTPEMIRKLISDALKMHQKPMDVIERTFLMISSFTGFSVKELKEMPDEVLEKYVETLIRGQKNAINSNKGVSYN